LLRCEALAKLLQEAMTALQNTLDEFLAAEMRDNLHSGQTRTGTGDMRAEQIAVVSENLTTLTPARNADVKLLLINRRQRTRRRDDQNFIHGLALGGV
jgi:hypothetical protein